VSCSQLRKARPTTKFAFNNVNNTTKKVNWGSLLLLFYKKTKKQGLEPYSPTTTRMLASKPFIIISKMGRRAHNPFYACSFPERFTLSSSILPFASLGFAIAHDWYMDLFM
jgi:hypothetical protein